MEWLWKMIDHFKKYVAGSALQSFATIDWIVVAALFWGLVRGSRKGFSDMFGRLLGIFIVSMLTFSFYELGSENLLALIPALPVTVARIFSFILWGICLWLIVYSGINFIGKFLKLEAQGLFKTLGGIVLGFLHMLILISFLSQFVLLFPFDSLQNSFKQGRTYTGYAVSQLVPDLHAFIVSAFSGRISDKPGFKKAAASHKVGR